MATIRRNLYANFCGVGISAGAPLLFNIFYFNFLGSEAYGLVGLYLTVQMLAVSLDFGLTRTTTREVASAQGQKDCAGSIRTTVFTMLVLNSLVFVIVCLVIISCSEWIAFNWIERNVVDGFEVSNAISLIGASVALQQPRSIFLGALNGLQGQVMTNILTASAAISRGFVTLFALYPNPTLSVFFWTQLSMTLVETVVMGLVVWRKLPDAGNTPRFDVSLVRRVAGFAVGDGVNVIVGALVIHSDKLLLSGMVSLRAFGTYSLLSLLAQAMSRLAAPFTMAYFPPLVTYWQKGDSAGLAKCFRHASLGLATLLMPATLGVIALSGAITEIVLEEGSGIPQSGTILAVLALAFACNAMMHLPYTIQLASGWTHAGLIMNLAVFCIYVPSLVVFVPVYGIIAAAWLLLAAMSIPLPIFIEVTRRRLLENRPWWTEVFIIPVIIATALMAPLYFAAEILSPWIAIGAGIPAGLAAIFLTRYAGSKMEERKLPG